MEIIWVKSLISKEKWNNYYSKIPGYTNLFNEEKNVWIGFNILKKNIDDRHIEILDYNDLMKIQKHREMVNFYPQPMPLKQM